MKHNQRQQCCIFAVDDFINYRNNNIDKFSQIFIHEILTNQRRFFAFVNKINLFNKTNFLLRHSMLQLIKNMKCINLFAINARKLYILSTHEENEMTRLNDNQFLHVN